MKRISKQLLENLIHFNEYSHKQAGKYIFDLRIEIPKTFILSSSIVLVFLSTFSERNAYFWISASIFLIIITICLFVMQLMQKFHDQYFLDSLDDSVFLEDLREVKNRKKFLKGLKQLEQKIKNRGGANESYFKSEFWLSVLLPVFLAGLILLLFSKL